MVFLSKPAMEQFSLQFSPFPLIDLSKPDAQSQLVKACEEVGFFKVINHGVPFEFMAELESEAIKFFSLPLSEKLKALGYGNKNIGCNGDLGWVEYLLLTTDAADSIYHKFASIFGEPAADRFHCVLKDYLRAVKKMACRILEMVAEGLGIQPRDALSKMLMDEQSDSVFRVNHYPGRAEGGNVIGFGEHTDPQIISVLRSNNTTGLEIWVKEKEWISIPPDQHSFFINVGDSLQVMTNGRFKSVRHRVVANSPRPRISMIYFGGPPLSEKIAPLPSLMEGEDSLYNEFTWFEYKKSVYNSRLADNRLGLFEKIAAS
ncbi:hypothetical protein SASPL_117285 [Salvia splendens]|uniref:gibberellin 2beta-dioxygenase n=1 Tax=Salvia splendens TaxID=180675 RepID=A0A8X8ZXG2_SALSN|nr:gibberellin 2-beta-dioxygenase 1-like [Salvia splendens]KAG6420747.1 hypothetical protein SASPL_117285 [Salvia splendens]